MPLEYDVKKIKFDIRRYITIAVQKRDLDLKKTIAKFELEDGLSEKIILRIINNMELMKIIKIENGIIKEEK